LLPWEKVASALVLEVTEADDRTYYAIHAEMGGMKTEVIHDPIDGSEEATLVHCLEEPSVINCLTSVAIDVFESLEMIQHSRDRGCSTSHKN
jgi:hypothetical protein